MARYIDADLFLRNETKRCGSVPLIGTCTTDNESLAYQLAKALTVDVVEVVRCKDCKYCKPPEEFEFDSMCRMTKGFVELNDFCSYGERK